MLCSSSCLVGIQSLWMIIPNILDSIASISMCNPPTIITQPGISSHFSLVVRRNSKPSRCHERSMIRQCSKLYWPLANAECCLDVPSWYLVLDHAYNLVICMYTCIIHYDTHTYICTVGYAHDIWLSHQRSGVQNPNYHFAGEFHDQPWNVVAFPLYSKKPLHSPRTSWVEFFLMFITRITSGK